MPAGRPRKPMLVRAQEGDVAQRGANRFAEAVANAYVSRRGAPEEPPIFSVPKGATPATRDAMRFAKAHWRYLARELEREGLLSTVDEGMLTTAALAYGDMVSAFRNGGRTADLMQRYMQAADRMGLSESARAKFSKPQQPMDELESVLCG